MNEIFIRLELVNLIMHSKRYFFFSKGIFENGVKSLGRVIGKGLVLNEIRPLHIGQFLVLKLGGVLLLGKLIEFQVILGVENQIGPIKNAAIEGRLRLRNQIQLGPSVIHKQSLIGLSPRAFILLSDSMRHNFLFYVKNIFPHRFGVVIVQNVYIFGLSAMIQFLPENLKIIIVFELTKEIGDFQILVDFHIGSKEDILAHQKIFDPPTPHLQRRIIEKNGLLIMRQNIPQIFLGVGVSGERRVPQIPLFKIGARNLDEIPRHFTEKMLHVPQRINLQF